MTREEARASIAAEQTGCATAALGGSMAARNGVSWTKNPCPRGTPRHRAWLDGYRIAVETPVPAYRLPGDRRAA